MGAQAVKARNEATAAAIVFLIVSSRGMPGQGYACTLRQATTRRALIFLSSGAENKKPRRTGAFESGVTTLSAGALSDLRLARELPCERFPFGTRVVGMIL